MSHYQIEREHPWLYPIGLFFSGTIFVLLTMVILSALFSRQRQKRLQALESHVFPERYQAEVMKRYPHLSTEDINLAFEQLRFYFSICLIKKPTPVAMPSRIVDVCWHVFISDTRQYKQFCERVFGDFLHHEAWVEVNLSIKNDFIEVVEHKDQNDLSEELKAQHALEFRNLLAAARIHQWASELEDKEQNSMPPAVPLLFRIDSKLAIKDGFLYPQELTQFLAEYDLKAAESVAASQDLAAAGSSGVDCGDGGSAAACGGCGGSV